MMNLHCFLKTSIIQAITSESSLFQAMKQLGENSHLMSSEIVFDLQGANKSCFIHNCHVIRFFRMYHSGGPRISLHFGTLWPGLHCYLATYHPPIPKSEEAKIWQISKFPSFTFFKCWKLFPPTGDHDGKFVLFHPVPSWRYAEGYAIWGIIENGARGFLGGLTGWMGVMSLIEAGRGLDAWNGKPRVVKLYHVHCIHHHVYKSYKS